MEESAGIIAAQRVIFRNQLAQRQRARREALARVCPPDLLPNYSEFRGVTRKRRLVEEDQIASKRLRTSAPPTLPVGETTPAISVSPAIDKRKHHKNDYSQRFVETGERPQNFILDPLELERAFDEYPKYKQLIRLKDEQIAAHSTPPFTLRCDLRTFDLASLGSKFDVVLIDPPWEEYARRAALLSPFPPSDISPKECWNFEDILHLRIELIADTPSFVFLWVGSAEGLDYGRQLLHKWGFRRCEDICWLKRNRTRVRRADPSVSILNDASSLAQIGRDRVQVLRHTKEHCLVGVKSTVNRNQFPAFVHANIDSDIIITEEPDEPGSTRKPVELYRIIERLCLGRRRLELFGRDHNVRRGWVTLGKDLSTSNYSSEKYASVIASERWMPTTSEIEELRPKSPPRPAA